MSYAVISEWVSKNSRRSTEGQAQEQAAKEKFAPGDLPPTSRTKLRLVNSAQ
jgi:hypothetical protein